MFQIILKTISKMKFQCKDLAIYLANHRGLFFEWRINYSLKFLIRMTQLAAISTFDSKIRDFFIKTFFQTKKYSPWVPWCLIALILTWTLFVKFFVDDYIILYVLNCLSLSLFLSLSHTHSLTHSLTHLLTHSLSLSVSLSITHKHTHTTHLYNSM
jgi:hypothetical protein